MLLRSLLSAGVDTTVTGIGNTIWCLANNPAELAKLQADPALPRAPLALHLAGPLLLPHGQMRAV